MKNITNNTEEIRNINGGSGTAVAVMGAMGLIYGAYEACRGAWNLGWWLGNKIRGK